MSRSPTEIVREEGTSELERSATVHRALRPPLTAATQNCEKSTARGSSLQRSPISPAMKPRSQKNSGYSVLQVTSPLPWWKRAIDIFCCLLALPALVIITLVVAVLTALTSPGPIFFKQERIGYRGRKFRLYKFRTMHASAETSVHRDHFAQLVRSNTPMQKMDARGDSRLIAGGWILRATGLDELPQLINVLRGEMSLVGPRPCIPYEYEQYSARQRERFASVPGLTGLWQVSGKNRTTFEEMVHFDVQYSRQRSLFLDLKIIVLTLPALYVQVRDVQRAKSKAVAKPSFETNARLQTAP
jgi:lipopolysaccharide/colanic/teichoic acid biosynthesis glycosyltransferase